jgi:hypothetical protein
VTVLVPELAGAIQLRVTVPPFRTQVGATGAIWYTAWVKVASDALKVQLLPTVPVMVSVGVTESPCDAAIVLFSEVAAHSV